MQGTRNRYSFIRGRCSGFLFSAGAGSGGNRSHYDHRRRVYLLFKEVGKLQQEVLLMKIVILRTPRFLAPLLRRMFRMKKG